MIVGEVVKPSCRFGGGHGAGVVAAVLVSGVVAGYAVQCQPKCYAASDVAPPCPRGWPGHGGVRYSPGVQNGHSGYLISLPRSGLCDSAVLAQQVWCLPSRWLPAARCCVDLGHEFAVGGARGGEVLLAFAELEAQLD